MARIILLQLVAALVVALLAGIFGNIYLGNLSYGLSALFGGMSCAIPNALFALRLTVSARRPGGANPMSFFIGEFFKVTLTIALMAAVVFWYRDVNWPVFLIAFIVVLKSYFILLFRR